MQEFYEKEGISVPIKHTVKAVDGYILYPSARNIVENIVNVYKKRFMHIIPAQIMPLLDVGGGLDRDCKIVGVKKPFNVMMPRYRYLLLISENIFAGMVPANQYIVICRELLRIHSCFDGRVLKPPVEDFVAILRNFGFYYAGKKENVPNILAPDFDNELFEKQMMEEAQWD